MRPPSSHTTRRTVPYPAVPALLGFVVLYACRSISAHPYLAGSARYFQVSGSLAGHLLGTIKKQPSPRTTGSGLRRTTGPTTMPSADFCPLIPPTYDDGSPTASGQTSRGKTHDFPPIYPSHLRRLASGQHRASHLLACSPSGRRLLCASCSSGREFAYTFLQIPPHGRHPWCSARGSGCLGPRRDFSPSKSLPHSLSLLGCQRQLRRCAPCPAY